MVGKKREKEKEKKEKEKEKMDEWEQLHGILLREHHFQLPLDHSRPEGETIPVFARECISSVMVDKEKEIPWVVFLQGGSFFFFFPFFFFFCVFRVLFSTFVHFSLCD